MSTPLEEGNLPLVATKEYGGEYDAESYMAGWEMGSLYEMLTSGQAGSISLGIRAENLKQADLLAMSLGFVMITHEFQGGIAIVEIYRAAPDFEGR